MKHSSMFYYLVMCFIGFLTPSILCTVSSTAYSAIMSQQFPCQPTPDNAVVLVDVNGTLCQTQILTAAITWLRNAPTIINRFWRLKNKYPSYNAAFQEASSVAASCQNIMKPIQDLVISLKKQGFKVYIFTGLFPSMVRELQKRYPDCFGLFDGFICRGPDCGWKDKHCDEFFAYAEKRLQLDGHYAKQIYFFDDQEQHAKRARKRGWKAVAAQDPYELVRAAHTFGFK